MISSLRLVTVTAAAVAALFHVVADGASPHGCTLKPKEGSNVKHNNDGKHIKNTEGTLDMNDIDFNTCFALQELDKEKASRSSSNNGKRKAKVDLQLLPDEPSLEFEVEYSSNDTNSKIITGKLIDDDNKQQDDDQIAGELNIILNDNGKIEVGSVHTNDAFYQISTLEDGVTMVTNKILYKDLPKDDPQDLHHDKELTRESSEYDIEDMERRHLRSSNSLSSPLPSPANVLPAKLSQQQEQQQQQHEERSLVVDGTDTTMEHYTQTGGDYFDKSELLDGITEGWIIDVMVPYTQRTMCAIVQAGSPDRCLWTESRHKVVLKRIELAITEANVAFQKSGIPGRVRLVHTFMIESSDFDEDGLSYADILRALAYTTDGFMDNVTPLRDQYGADIVSLFVDNQSSCGLAYVGTPVSKSWTFSAVNWICATGYYSFVHEIGHHMAARHDRRVEGCPDGACCGDLGGCDRYGYLDPLSRYRSIMSYNCPVEGGCPRVQVFSTPSKPYVTPIGRELAIGDTLHNNAKAITSVFRQVVSYRAHYTPVVTDAPVQAPSHCGNGVCEGHLGENCRTCREDCIVGRYKPSECGNGICEAEEDCLNCADDCGGRLDIANDAHKYCCVGGPKNLISDLNIQFSLSCDDHPYDYCLFNADCSLEPATTSTYCCGNGVCELGEGMWNCGTDCKCNDNNVCDFWEDTSCADCQGLNDLLDNAGGKCMGNGRNCVGIVPDPCCGGCNQDTRVCESL